MKENTDIPYRHYVKGDSSEVMMYFSKYYFIVETVPIINYCILKNSKKKK